MRIPAPTLPPGDAARLDLRILGTGRVCSFHRVFTPHTRPVRLIGLLTYSGERPLPNQSSWETIRVFICREDKLWFSPDPVGERDVERIEAAVAAGAW